MTRAPQDSAQFPARQEGGEVAAGRAAMPVEASRAQHTPGPWFVQPSFLTIYAMSDGYVGLTCALASVLRDQPGVAAAKANARLIAAAPDLLAALDALLALHIAHHNNPAHVAARAAIAKARGA
jgi:hypothetical protein